MNIARKAFKRFLLRRWVIGLALTVCIISPTLESVATAQQIGPTAEPLPGLWDAAGRSFLGGRYPVNKIGAVSIDVGEFIDDSSIVLLNSDLQQRVATMYLPESDNLLDEMIPTELQRLGLIGIYGENVAPSGGQTSVFAFADLKWLFVVSVRGNYSAVPDALFSVVKSLLDVVRGSTLPQPTRSNQNTGSGLWSLLPTSESPIVTGYLQQDYLSPLFAGAVPSTPALDQGISALTIEQAASPFTPTTSSIQYAPVTQPVPADATQGVATLELRARLSAGEFEQSFYYGCYGIGSYSYLGLDATVRVLDATGVVVAAQEVPIGQYAANPADLSGASGGCLIVIDIANVPLGSSYYTIVNADVTVLTTSPPTDRSEWVVNF